MKNWNKRKISDFAPTKSGGTPATERKEYWENGTIPWINSGELSKNDFIKKPTTYITEKGLANSAATVMPPGTVVIALTGATTGMVAHLEIETTGNQSITGIFPSSEHDPLYLFYFLKNCRDRIVGFNIGSAQPHINKQIVDDFEVILPTVSEQTQIATILSCIDREIEHTKALIAKQQRIKTGLMQDLLTKGIDEHGNIRSEATHAFKDSPLGRIPKGWDAVRVADVKRVITSGSRGWAKYYAEEGALFLRIGNLTREHINLRLDNLIKVEPPSNNEGIRTALQEGDVLVSVTADIGIIGVIPADFGESYVNQHIALVRLDKETIYPRWVAHFLAGKSGERQFLMLNESGAKAGLNLPTVASLLVAKPESYQEQRIVSDIIDRCASTIEASKRQLNKYRFLKAGLMQDLLTGKVRVSSLLAGSMETSAVS